MNVRPRGETTCFTLIQDASENDKTQCICNIVEYDIWKPGLV